MWKGSGVERTGMVFASDAACYNSDVQPVGQDFIVADE
jgi:hypothetical protein